MTTPLRRTKLRLWVVSLALFVGGFASRLALDAQGDVGSSYPAAVAIQWYAYGAGLVVWAAWWALQAPPGRGSALGCLAGVLLAIASLFAVISSIPK
jgi:hypothetical protein